MTVERAWGLGAGGGGGLVLFPPPPAPGQGQTGRRSALDCSGHKVQTQDDGWSLSVVCFPKRLTLRKATG